MPLKQPITLITNRVSDKIAVTDTQTKLPPQQSASILHDWMKNHTTHTILLIKM